MPNFSFLDSVEVTFLAGWSESDDKVISVQLNIPSSMLQHIHILVQILQAEGRKWLLFLSL